MSDMRARMRSTLALLAAAAVALAMVAGGPRPARAYEADVHYALTYYLALHAGFTERQAFQIASATQAIDDDKDTGPLEATAWDAALGAERDVYAVQAAADAMNEARADLKAFLARERIADPNIAAERWMVGVKWDRWVAERPRIQNVWSRFHAFAEAELAQTAAPYQPGFEAHPQIDRELGEVNGRIEALEYRIRTAQMARDDGALAALLAEYDALRRQRETVRARSERSMPVLFGQWYRSFQTYYGSRRGDRITDTPEIQAVRRLNMEALWALALAERNLGPFMHFLQDSFSHHDYDNVKGHAQEGHHPDILAFNPAKAMRMVMATLHRLCMFRAATMAERDRQVMAELPTVCDIIGAERDYTFEEVTALSRHPPMRRIFQVVVKLIEVNPVPPAIFDRIGGQLTGALEGLVRGYVWSGFRLPAEFKGMSDEERAIEVVHQAISEDREQGRLPSGDGNLERRWGYPPSSTDRGNVATPGGVTSLSDVVPDIGAVWPRWTMPTQWIRYDFDRDGRVVHAGLRPPEEYVGGSAWRAALDGFRRKLDDDRETYPLERLDLEVPGPIEMALVESRRRPGEVEVHVRPSYVVRGMKDLGSRPLPMVVGCELDGYPLRRMSDQAGNPYGQKRRPANQDRWGRDGVGDDWGTKVVAREIARGGTYREHIWFHVKAADARRGLKGACTVHFYRFKPVTLAIAGRLQGPPAPAGALLLFEVSVSAGRGIMPAR